MRVLVTGGAGFIGSHLCDELLHRGHRVICVDNLETGSLVNIEHIRVPEFVHVNTDITEPFFVDEPVDVVYHLASPASPIDYLRLPLHTLKVGSHGTHHTLGLAKRHRARFLLASTSEVYGTAQFVPITEEHPLQGQSPYSATKIGADQLAYSFFSSFGLPIVIARPFNTFGPRQSARAVIPTGQEIHLASSRAASHLLSFAFRLRFTPAR